MRRWTAGESFNKICEITSQQEGQVVRDIMRLGDACRDVGKAAKVIGDSELAMKMEIAVEMIRRDVVYAASLYLE